MKRTLTLEREALTELSDGDLSGVVGAAPYSNEQITCPNLGDCAGPLDVSQLVTCRRCLTGLDC